MSQNEQRIRAEWLKAQREAAALRAEIEANPWEILLNGKHYARTYNHAQCRRICAALARKYPAAAIAQNYQGRGIDHQPDRTREQY